MSSCDRSSRTAKRAWARMPSGCRLNLLDPHVDGWTDQDLADRLARVPRWAGDSAWPLPLSVAQHSLLVLEIARAEAGPGFTPAQALRELLHDAEEAFLGFDLMSPLKPILGRAFADLTERLVRVIWQRYGLVPWTPAQCAAHKRADRVAAASEAVMCTNWPEAEVRRVLRIAAPILTDDPLVCRYGGQPWECWAPDLATARFLDQLKDLQRRVALTDNVAAGG